MVVFHKLTYRNFLAAGNAPITIQLDTHPNVLIVGKNGTGKSTMSEALCFALYGRALREVNKPSLVNTINARDCVVEIEFTSKNRHFRIKRGMKPAIFEIYEDDKLLPQPAAVADYQTMLETHIVGINFKAFQQVVVLGNASYIPFMRLNTATRRSIIESLLDIEVFSSMNALTKEELADLKIEIDKVAQAKQLVGQQIVMAQTFTEHLEEERQAKLANVVSQIEKTAETIRGLETEKAELTTELATYDASKQALATAQGKKQEYERTLFAIESKEKKTRKERAFYEEHDECPTCAQSITEAFKKERYSALEKKAQDAAKAIAQCKGLIAKYEGQVQACEQELEQARVLSIGINGIESKLPLHRKRMKELMAEKVELEQPKPQQSVDVDALQAQLSELHAKHEVLSRKKLIAEAASTLLKDNGIKARVVRHYLPIINKQINHYLNALDFPIQFVLDEQFEEHLKSRHRDDFTYYNFSEGEKKRIDLALLLTWRAVARLKHSAATNLLILDEVFDSSLDAAGTEEFLKVIADLERDTNVFVISHKTDALVDKFAHTLTFEKQRGFSTLR